MATTLLATATADDIYLRVFTDHPPGSTVTVNRSMKGIVSTIRGGNYAPIGDLGVWAQRDVEVLYGIEIRYTALIRDSAGVLLETANAAATVANPGAVLRDVLMPSRRIKLRLVGSEAGDSTSDVRRELLRPLGRAAPVVVFDVRSAQSGTTTALTLDAGEQRAMRDILSSGRVMIFTGPADWDIYWPLYISVGKTALKRTGAALSEARLWEFDWDEVDPPDLSLYAPVNARTWGDVLAATDSWADIVAVPWLDVIYPPTVARSEAAA